MSIVETYSYRWRMELNKRRDNSIESDTMFYNFYLDSIVNPYESRRRSPKTC